MNAKTSYRAGTDTGSLTNKIEIMVDPITPSDGSTVWNATIGNTEIPAFLRVTPEPWLRTQSAQTLKI
jgi:hypothetical protein